jgi:hypothetical protein
VLIKDSSSHCCETISNNWRRLVLTPEDQSKIANIRAKHLAGTAEPKDYHAYFEILRQGRLSSQSSAGKSKAKKAPVNVEALFDEIDKV